MDLNPFMPVGIDEATARFLDVFLLHCLLSDSPPDTPQEIAALGRNQQHTASRGREPGLRLERDGQQVLLTDWARELVDACAPIAQGLDEVLGGVAYHQAWQVADAALRDPSTLPSAKVVAALTQGPAGLGHAGFCQAWSARSRQALLGLDLPEEAGRAFAAQAEASLREQAEIEQADALPFEAFRQDYMSPSHLVV
jgi:glutamate--cysteine ligase